jgi:hypothetical protein
MIQNYCPLINFPDLPEKFYKEAEEGNYKIEFRPNVYSSYSSFEETDFVKMIDRDLGVTPWCRYHKMPPKTMYDWHKDQGGRKSAFNFVIKPVPEGYCFFGTLKNMNTKEQHTEDMVYFYDIDSVVYLPGKPTLLNVFNRHCIINASDQERIILSISLDIEYKVALQFFQHLKITEY